MKTKQPKAQSDSRELPARAKGRERRRQIIEAAKRQLLTAGIEGLVLRDIAEQLGITHGNLQYYFPTKSGLIEAIFDEEIIKYTDTMKHALSATSTQQGRLAAFLDSSVDLLAIDEVRLWHVLFGIAHQNPDLANILKRENDRYEAVLADELACIFPEMPADRRKHASRMIRMLIDGLGITVIYERPESPEMLAMKGELKAMLNIMLRAD